MILRTEARLAVTCCVSILTMCRIARADGTSPATGNDPGPSIIQVGPQAEEAVTHYVHFSGGLVGATVAFVGDDKKGYVGVSLLPEIRFAVSTDSGGKWRVFAAARVSVLDNFFSKASAVAPEQTDHIEGMVIAGTSVRLVPEKQDQSVTVASNRLSLGVGYGNFQVKSHSDGPVFRDGPLLSLSLDVEAVGFHF